MILVIDNYDSFTYNLVQYLGRLGADVVTHRNDRISLSEIAELRPQGILLSPGPCTPERSAICLPLIAAVLRRTHSDVEALGPEERAILESTPLFGVCLGMQATGLIAGATVRRAKEIRHGKASLIEHEGGGVFEGLPSPYSAIRYHSLVIDEATLPSEFEVSARALDDGEIMGIRHQSGLIEGVQFHPESALSENGLSLMANALRFLTSGSSVAAG